MRFYLLHAHNEVKEKNYNLFERRKEKKRKLKYLLSKRIMKLLKRRTKL